MSDRLKVAIICHVSNKMVRSHLKLRTYALKNAIKRIIGRPPSSYHDYGTWNTISLNEYGAYKDVEIHAIVPHPGMKDKYTSFENNGVYYHFFYQSNKERENYKINRECISLYLNAVKPDLICIVGIEAPFYALSALDIDTSKVPLVVVMQTALSDPDFTKLYPIDKLLYEKMLLCEKSVLKHSYYIASDVEWHRSLARRINPNAIFVRYYFCTDTSIKIESVEKQYDFVYWASNIEKAGIDALKAFSIALKKRKDITLNLVGFYTPEFYQVVMDFIQEEKLENNVFISGYFPSHEEALIQVQKSRYALVPIKIDIISTTIREAAIMKMPIVTFITKGTPSMNKEKQCIMLSEIDDYEEMANNMLKLVEQKKLGDMLAQNAYDYAIKSFNNEVGARINIEMFKAVYSHFSEGKAIPDDISKACL